MVIKFDTQFSMTPNFHCTGEHLTGKERFFASAHGMVWQSGFKHKEPKPEGDITTWSRLLNLNPSQIVYVRNQHLT